MRPTSEPSSEYDALNASEAWREGAVRPGGPLRNIFPDDDEPETEIEELEPR